MNDLALDVSCFLVNFTPDHLYPSGGFSSNKVNCVKPVQGSDKFCEGCDIVQSDHAPQAGVAQGIFDGELVRRRVGHRVELEEEQDEEVERRVRRDAQRTTHRCACMDDME